MRREDYHPKWDVISFVARYEWAGNVCQTCGVRNHALIRRTPKTDEWTYANCCDLLWMVSLRVGNGWSENRARKYLGLTEVTLTTSHTDRDRENNRKSNLQALCQRCHLLHDLPQHVRNAKYGRYHDREHQLTLF